MITPTVQTKEDLQLAILHQLGIGEEYAIHGKPLAQRLGFKDDRLIREEIVKMRRTGIRIIGSLKGYYIAKNNREILESIEFTKKYVISLCKDMADLKRLLNQVNGQFRMKF